MRLIDADALNSMKFHDLPYTHIIPYGCEAKSYERGWNDAIDSIVEGEPTIEPERKKGEWIKVGHWGRSYKCNQCGNYLDFDGVNAGRGDANFCPNCGADMSRGES